MDVAIPDTQGLCACTRFASHVFLAFFNIQLSSLLLLQMHIHIAHFGERSAPDVEPADWLVRTVARAANISQNPASPTRILGEGYYNPAQFSGTPLGRPPKYWARAYLIHVPTQDPVADLGVSGLGWLGGWGGRGGGGRQHSQDVRECLARQRISRFQFCVLLAAEEGGGA